VLKEQELAREGGEEGMASTNEFMAFTGCSSRVEADGWLEMYSNHMTSAVEAYYAMNGYILT